jgi:hypothetical protein
LVNLVEDWEDIEKYTRHLVRWTKIGSYQPRKSDEGSEIKVCVGKLGYAKEFKVPEASEFIKILALCQDGWRLHKGCGKRLK